MTGTVTFVNDHDSRRSNQPAEIGHRVILSIRTIGRCLLQLRRIPADSSYSGHGRQAAIRVQPPWRHGRDRTRQEEGHPGGGVSRTE